jgi:superfamily II RNA helicase
LRDAEPVATDAYWTLSTEWVEVIDRWMSGAPVAEVCSDFGLYEGNLMRMLLKMVNIVEEWRCLATLAKDVEMLEKLRGVEVSLLRDVAVCDSLYLRL